MAGDAFSIFCEAAVIYHGRAMSSLATGNYLILKKPDGCLAVHGGSLVKPLNYQGPGSSVKFMDAGQDFDDLWMNLFDSKPQFLIEVNSKCESLVIAVYEVHQRCDYDGWTVNKVVLERSERDLVAHIVDNIYDYFDDVMLVDTEVPTPYGNVDVMVMDSLSVRHIIEVKRRIVSVAGCGQVARYRAYFRSVGLPIKEYVAAPAITKNAISYANTHDQKWLEVSFPE